MIILKELILYYSMLAEDQDINKADISSLTALKVDGEGCWNSVSDLLCKFPHLEEISINVDEGENIDEKIFLQCPKLKKIHCYQLSGFHENFGMEELASLENLEEISALRLMDHCGITKFKKIKKIDSLYIDEVLDIPAFVDCLQSIEVRMLGIGSLEGLPEEYFLLGKLNQSLKNIYIRGGNIKNMAN